MSDEKRGRARPLDQLTAKEIQQLMESQGGLLDAYMLAMEREAGKKSLTPDAINKANGGDK